MRGAALRAAPVRAIDTCEIRNVGAECNCSSNDCCQMQQKCNCFPLVMDAGTPSLARLMQQAPLRGRQESCSFLQPFHLSCKLLQSLHLHLSLQLLQHQHAFKPHEESLEASARCDPLLEQARWARWRPRRSAAMASSLAPLLVLDSQHW